MADNKNIVDSALQLPGKLAGDAFNSLYNTAQNEQGVTGDVARSIVDKLDKAAGPAEKLATPYREYSAKPLSALLLTIKDYGHDGFNIRKTWDTAWKQAAHVSPGQAAYGLFASPNINWDNEGDVKRFFEADNTKQERISGAIDVVANIFLDPLVFAGKAAKIGRAATLGMRGVERKGVLRLTGNNQAKLIDDLEKARTGSKNSASVVIDKIMEHANDFGAMESLPIVARSTDPTAVARAFMSAAQSGGKDSVIDIMRVSIGDESIIPKLEKQNAELAERVTQIRRQRTSVNNQIKQLNERVSYLNDRPNMSAKQLLEYEKVQADLLKAKAKAKKIKGKMATTVAKSDTILQSTSAEENVFGRVGRELAWSRSKYHEHVRNALGEWSGKGWQANINAVDDPFNTEIDNAAIRLGKKTGSGAADLTVRAIRTATTYVSPSYKMKEVPAGTVTIAGDVGNDSVREVRARIVQAAKEAKWSKSEQAKFYTRYAMLRTDSERFQFLNQFEQLTIQRQLRNKVQELGLDVKFNTRQRKVFSDVISKLAEDATKSKYSFLNKIINEQNYTYVDELTGEPVVLDDLRKHVQDIAKQLAKQDKRKDWENYENRAKKLISETPQTRTQIPNIHFGINFTEYQKLLDDEPGLIKAIAAKIEQRPNIESKELIDMLNEISTSGLESKYEMTKSVLKRSWDFNIVPAYQSYQNYIWKPMTLLSLRYTSRNLFESEGRIHAAVSDMTGYYGYSMTSLVRGLFGTSGVTAPVKSGAVRGKSLVTRTLAKDKKIAAHNAMEANEQAIGRKFGIKQFDSGAKIAEKISKRYLQDGEHYLKLAKDTLSASMHYSNEYFSSLKGFRGTGVNKVATDKIYNIGMNVFNAPNKKGVSQELLKKLHYGDIEGAYRIAISIDPDTVFKTLEFVSSRAISAQKQIREAIAGNYNIALREKADFGIKLLDTIKDNADVAKMAFDSDNRVRLMKDYNESLSVSEVAPKKITAYSEGRVKFGKGYSIAAPYADEMRRLTASASNSTSRAVLGAQRNTFQKLFEGPARQTTVAIDDSRWSAAHADYVNNILYRDDVGKIIIDMSVTPRDPRNPVVAKRIKSMTGEKKAQYLAGDYSPAEIKDYITNYWLKSRDSLQWRREKKIDLRETRKKLNGADYEVFTDSIYAQISQYLPMASADSADGLRFLRDKLAKGTLTDVDSAKIPMGFRQPMYANLPTRQGLFKSIPMFAINNLFHMLATLPEDNLARHPFYNAVYRAEGDRLANQLQKKGISGEQFTEKYEKMVETAAHAAARKAVVDKLYTVERNTNMASVLRFLSPFYMAQQNSTRYWLGTTLRNPEVAYRIVASYTLPYRLGYVQNRDDNYNNVNQIGHPWNAKGMVLVYDYPQWMRNKLFGGSDAYKREIPISGFDVIFQGQRPGVPQIGSPAATFSLGLIMRSIKGKDYDPQKFMDKYGINLDDVIKEIQPYYEASRGKGIVGQATQAGFTGSVALQKSIIAIGGMAGQFNSVTDGQQFADRVDVILTDKLVKLAESGMPITQKTITSLREEAVATAVKSFWAEALMAGGPTISTQRFRTGTEIGRQAELRKYTDQYGYELGVVKFTESLDTQGSAQAPYVVSLLTDSNVDNRFGFISTQQTLNGVYANEKLIAAADKMVADKHLISSFFNQGDSTKYDQVVSDVYYNINVNGKPIKFRADDRFGGEEDAQIRAGNREYYKKIELIEQQARLSGYSSGSKEYQALIQPKKDAILAETQAKYPIWAEREVSLRVNRVEKNLAAAQMIVQDSTFKSTVGSGNTMASAMRAYLDARSHLIGELDKARAASGRKTIEAKDNAYVGILRDQVVAEIDRAYPGFQRVFDIYFSGDKLNDITMYVD